LKREEELKKRRFLSKIIPTATNLHRYMLQYST
jgi:hypothetical protein